MTTPRTAPQPLPLLAQSWLLDQAGRGCARGSLGPYRAALADLTRHLQFTDYVDASKNDLREWTVDMATRLAQNTVRQRVSIIKSFYVWLAAEGELPSPGRNPATTLKAPAEILPPVQTIDLDQMKKLLATCGTNSFQDRRDRAVLMALLDGGMRRAECADLLVSDFDLSKGTLHIVGKGSPMRGPKHRMMTVGLRTCQALSTYLRVRQKVVGSANVEHLWVSARHGRRLTTSGIRYIVEKRGKAAGLDLHAHVLRHTWASQSRREGLQEGDLMVLGGWSNRRQLDRYGQADAADRAQEAYRSRSVGDRLGRGQAPSVSVELTDVMRQRRRKQI